MDVMLLFDAIMIILGAYLLFIACKMNKEGRVPTFLIAEQELMHCRDQKAMSGYLCPRIIAFSVVILVFGGQGMINDLLMDFGKAVNIIMILVFLAAWVWFSVELRKARKKFC